MSHPVDLDAYCKRIGYAGPRTATLETLRALHLLHPQAIAFENLNPFLGLPVSLAPGALTRKLVGSRRGGYCFEHNLLFGDVLRSLGFEVHNRAARVLLDVPDDRVMARNHMLLLIVLDGQSYVVDVGFGGLTMTAPLLLATPDEQATPHGPFRILRVGDDHIVQGRKGDQWWSLYRFDDQPQLAVDYEAANWFLSTHPRSRFVTGLMLGRPFSGGRYALLDNRLSIYRLDGGIDRRLLKSPDEFRETLESAFGIVVPEGIGVEAALARITRGETAS